MDFETMVVLFQRCIVNRDESIYFTNLFRNVSNLFKIKLNEYMKISQNIDITCPISEYKNFEKYMKSEIMKTQIYKFKGNR